MPWCPTTSLFFFFNDTATTEIYTLSLHDALPIYPTGRCCPPRCRSLDCPSWCSCSSPPRWRRSVESRAYKDRKSTRLNSSHSQISYAVFCLKKKNIGKNWFVVTTHFAAHVVMNKN